MSENPFRDSPDPNPYASPSEHAKPGNPLVVPAIFLLVFSILTLLVLTLSLPTQLVRIANIDVSTPEGIGEFTGSVVSLLVWFVFSLVVIAGSVCMLRLKGYSGALAAAIVAVFPVCSPCFVLGIPFGIWALILLRKPNVKQRFA